MTTHRARMEACLAGETIDRPPVALWRHFPVDDQTPEGLAASTLTFQRLFDFDVVKVTPASSYCLKDWGSRDVWRGNPEGTRDYTQRVIQNPDDWIRLQPLDPQRGHLAAELECLRMLVREIGPDTPIIQTIFNPLSQAKNLAGGAQLLVHMRQFPDELQQGLRIIAESTRRFVEALHGVGIDGIFFAVQHAQFGLLSRHEYQAFGRANDLEILAAASEMSIRMLHLHGLDVMFDEFVDYPINIINWHDRETSPSLGVGQSRFPGVVCGGVSIQSLTLGSAEQVRAEALDAIQATDGQRLLLGTGCVTPTIAPWGNIMTLRQSIEN